MNLEQLKSQQASLEQEQEAAKAAFYRTEGALAIVKAQITDLEKEISKNPGTCLCGVKPGETCKSDCPVGKSAKSKKSA